MAPFCFSLLVAATAAQAPVDPELAALEGQTVRCCHTGVCVQRPAAEGCTVDLPPPPPPPPAEPSDEEVARISDELTSPLEWFADAEPPFLTNRAQWARSILHAGTSHVIIGEIEGEYAFYGDHPEGGRRLMTWCTTSQSNSIRSAESTCLTLEASSSPRLMSST